MIEQYRELIDEVRELTGVEAPSVAAANAPVLVESALRQEQPMYLVGLIGGKDVGKSSLVNALVGQQISAQTSHGPGTEQVIAYCHEEQAEPLKSLLESEVPGQYRIVTHGIEDLRSQVLLDLPDIDSHYDAHVEITRRMLRHMLYPIWLQSIEKYADRRPQELLAAVAAGNAPGNFIFCLNKVDQAIGREGEQAVRELGADFAHRIAQQLGLSEPPRIWLISAIQPSQFDLPQLRKMLSSERNPAAVQQSRQLAQRQQGLSIARWLEAQDLDQRMEAMRRLEHAAEEELAARAGVPLIDTVIPRLLEDPAYRIGLSDELMNQRVKRWPIVNILHVLLGPLLSLLRLRMPIEQQAGLISADSLVEVHLRRMTGSQPLASVVQSTFAFLQQSSPLVSRLYGQQRLWESTAAENAAANLRRRLASTHERQRSTLRSRFSSGGLVGGLIRVVLTIGAVVWFPFAQPLLESYLAPGHGQVIYLLVQLLGVTYLLKNVAFLAIYFVILWLIIKWDTQRRVDRWLAHWKRGDKLDPALSLTGQVVEWSDELLMPVRNARQRMEKLLDRAGELRKSLRSERAA